MKRIISLRTFIIRFGVRKLFTKENIFQFVPALVWQVIRKQTCANPGETFDKSRLGDVSFQKEWT